jgi:TorA maturation chaperone TorD
MNMESTYVLPTLDPAILLARRLCYRFAALALADPQTGGWQELSDPETRAIVMRAAALLRDEDLAVARPLALGEQPLAELDPTTLFSRLPPSCAELNTAYDHNFGLLSGSKCPPYETEYVPSKFTFQRSNLLADVAGYYGAFGLQSSTRAPERPDHLVLELEYLAQLIGLQSAALHMNTTAAANQADVCLEAQGRFLQEHIVWWVPAFCTLLARQDPDGYYAATATFVAALVAADRALFRIAPPHMVPEPGPLDEPDACSGCQLAAQ